MIRLHRRIEDQLKRASTNWRLLWFVKQSAVLASLLMLVGLALGVAMWMEWLTHSVVLAIIFVLLVLGGGFVWLILGIMSIGASSQRTELAQAVERSNRSLLDRINTLVFLEGRTDGSSAVIADCIQKQTRVVLAEQPSRSPYSARRALPHFLTLLGVFAVTAWFYATFQPWQQVNAAKSVAANAAVEPPLEIPAQEPLAAIAPPEESPWGEIRISEPGRDLQATRLDIIPLQIEAAVNRAMKRVEWFTANNGSVETSHALPVPEDPRYAVYRPEIRLEEHGVQAWDVVSYYACVTCEDATAYVSDIYFIEVFPFREELDKLPGGSKGPAYELLSRLTGMIEHQQKVIRQTFREEHSPQPGPDRKKYLQTLAKHEASLTESTQHLAAQLRSRLDNDAIEDLSEHLKRTTDTLEVATKSLQGNDAAKARRDETAALANLIAARKRVHELTLENPDAFQNPDDFADDSIELLRKKQEQADNLELQADEFDKLVKKQRELVRRAAETQDAEELQKLADRQQALLETVERLMKEFPEESGMADGLQNEQRAAQQAMQRALEILDFELTDPAQLGKQQKALARAAAKMARLAEKMRRKAEEMQFAESMRLQRMLKKNIREYADVEKQPDRAARQDLEQTAGRTKDVLDELEKLTKRDTSEQQQKSEVGKVLEKQPREELEAQAEKLTTEDGDSEKQQLAGDIKQDLQKLSDALDADLARKRAELENMRLAEEMKLMEESQRHAQQAGDFLKQALLKERNIERAIKKIERMKTLKRHQELTKLARQQQQLTKSVEDFIKDNPEPFRDAESETHAAKNALKQANHSLARRDRNARRMAGQAADALQQLDSALEQQQQLDRLVDAYRLKKMLDQQISQLKRIEQNPGGTDQQQAKRAAERSQALADRLKQFADEPADEEGNAGGGFGESLKKALSDEKKQEIDSQARQLADARQTGERGESAGRLRKSMEDISKAFEQGNPGKFARRGHGGLSGGGISQGIRQAESLMKRMRNGRSDEQLRREALRNLIEALKNDYGQNERAKELIARLERMQTEPLFTFDVETIKELIRKIQSLRREAAIEDQRKSAGPDVRNLDPAKLPADYRKSIEKYFEKLSEQDN